jgi:hypothetical protein
MNTGTVVTPVDAATALILGRRKWSPQRGVVTGLAGRHLMVKWDGDRAGLDQATNPFNVKAI